MNKSKARLAFEMLEKEMETLSQEQQRNLKGGDIGAVTSGTGTSNDPFIITIPIYYGNDLSLDMQNSIHSSINSINTISSNGLTVNGKMYRYNAVATISANTASAQNDAGANSSYSGLIKTGNLTSSVGGAPILGDAGSVVATIDPFNVSMSNSSLSKVISHEIGHLLGLNHSTSSSSGMTASVTGNSNSGLTQEDLENVIRNRNW